MNMRNTLSLIALPLLVLGGCSTQKSAAPPANMAAVSVQRDPMVDRYVSQVRAELSTGKANVINAVMNLTSNEAMAFWPIYSEYEEELFGLGDRRLVLIERFGAAQAGGKFDNAAADSLAKDWLKLQRDSADLMQTYYGRLSKEVSPLHAAQFLQIEHRMNTVIDLVIASKMPWITAPDGTPRARTGIDAAPPPSKAKTSAALTSNSGA